MLPKVVCLFLTWSSLAFISADGARMCMASRFTWTAGDTTAMDQKSGLICHAAGCAVHDSTIFNQIEPTCGSQSVCQKCPVPAVTNGDVCSLVRADPGQANVVEGVLITTNKTSRNKDVESSGASADEDEDYDDMSFLQIDNLDMQFKPSTTDAEIKSNVASCAMDAHRNLDVSVRLVLQWYRVPGLKASGGTANTEHKDDGVMLDITPPSEISVGDTISHWDAHRPSFLEVLPNLTRKLKGLFSSDPDGDSYDDVPDTDKDGKTGNKFQNLVSSTKSFYKFVKVKLAKPRFYIHFTVSDQTITHCRQVQRWKGDLDDKSLLYTAVQNIRLKSPQLNGDFLKRAIRVHITCKGCELLQYVSCLQVTCPQKRPVTRNLGMPPHSVMRPSGIIQPMMTMATGPAFVGTTAPASTMSLPSMSASAPRAVYTPNALVAGYATPLYHTNSGHVAGLTFAMVALLVCMVDNTL